LVGHIVHCASYGGPYSGSFVPMLAGAARAARDRGYETTICFSEIARNRPWLDELSDLADIRFITGTRTLDVVRELKSIVDRTGRPPTVLHTQFGQFDVPVALLGIQRRRTAVVWHAQGESQRKVRLRGKVYGTVFSRIVDAFLCVSPEVYEEARARRFPPAKLHLFPNAIDLHRFTPITPDERSVARRQLGQSSSASVVLHLGWDWERKGGDLLLAAADLLVSEPDLAFFTVVGEGVEGEQFEYHPNVRRLAPHGAVNELYAAADIFLNCSRSEGMPFALLEALARGLLVVATDLPVQRELLDGLPGARAVAPDPIAISGAIRELLALTTEQRAAHAMAARARVAATYALDVWAQRLVDLYDEVLTGASKS